MARRTTRSWSRAGVAVAAMALLGASAPVVGSTVVAGSAAAECDPSGEYSAARAMSGSHGVDPNSVTRGEAAAMQRTLERRLDRLVRRGEVTPSGRLTAGRGAYDVDTHVHIIEPEAGAGATEEQVLAQMQVLNQAFRGAGKSVRTPFRFVLRSIDYTTNPEWYEWSVDPEAGEESPAVLAAKEALHVGGPDDLNIYVAGLVDSGLLGYATFPGEVPLEQDGLVLLDGSLPGGWAEPYNLGDTATHEIGHWLGLFHTFENGCVTPGDYVSDTPYQLDGDNIFECNERDDTCKQPGRDPVHNFMSYGDDLCLDRFTTGQAWRMTRAWAAFRYQR